ncbi:MAG: glutamate--tRNA ligase, partial [Alphaproteobacteria bacterium]|nr:glutamate--tRNA ligase [Alphaproteobacteria bacterium]
AKLLHHLPWSAVADRLPDASERFWLAIRGNIQKLSDSNTWAKIITNGINPVIAPDDRTFVSAARSLLPDEPWDETTWKRWTDAVKSGTDRKGRGLFMPLRLALTGLDHGPELAHMLPLIGREKALERLA